MTGRYRVVIADDHPLILLTLRQLIAAERDFEVVGEAATGLDARSLIRRLAPDMAVIDLAMPGLSGMALARTARDETPAVKIVVLTAFEDEGRLKQALATGVSGFILKRAAAELLVPAMRAAMTGGTFVDPLISGKLDKSQRSGAGELSRREEDVLRFTALGHSTKEIALVMSIGAKSVDTYRNRACEKFGLKTRADIVRYASAQGWLA